MRRRRGRLESNRADELVATTTRSTMASCSGDAGVVGDVVPDVVVVPLVQPKVPTVPRRTPAVEPKRVPTVPRRTPAVEPKRVPNLSPRASHPLWMCDNMRLECRWIWRGPARTRSRNRRQRASVGHRSREPPGLPMGDSARAFRLCPASARVRSGITIHMRVHETGAHAVDIGDEWPSWCRSRSTLQIVERARHRHRNGSRATLSGARFKS